MKVVIYEVWTRSRVIEAESSAAAIRNMDNDPIPIPGMALCNWHAVSLEDEAPRPAGVPPKVKADAE
jgi:hypothetical protein